MIQSSSRNQPISSTQIVRDHFLLLLLQLVFILIGGLMTHHIVEMND